MAAGKLGIDQNSEKVKLLWRDTADEVPLDDHLRSPYAPTYKENYVASAESEHIGNLETQDNR